MSTRIELNSHVRFPIVFRLTFDLLLDKPDGDVALMMLPGAWMHAQDSGFVASWKPREIAGCPSIP
mgnify:FL=1